MQNLLTIAVGSWIFETYYSCMPTFMYVPVNNMLYLTGRTLLKHLQASPQVSLTLFIRWKRGCQAANLLLMKLRWGQSTALNPLLLNNKIPESKQTPERSRPFIILSCYRVLLSNYLTS